MLALTPADVRSQEEPPATPSAERPTGQAEPIDFGRARLLLQKLRQGDKLLPEDQAYLDRARAERRKTGAAPPARGVVRTSRDSLELTPLTDFAPTEKYRGESGGLYGNGANEPPTEHLQAALAQAARVMPLDTAGKPSQTGKVVLISSGMSNVTQEFQRFLQLAQEDKLKSSSLVIVDGAQGGQEASDWARPDNRFRQERADPWQVLEQRLQQAGVTAEQVQVLWLKQARRNPAALGEFPLHARTMQDDLVRVLQEMKRRFPNLRIAYLSSRIYAGYAGSPLNPEPYAYETAFTMRWLIQDQMQGTEALNFDPEKGDVKAPLLLWGPYLWANGVKGRKIDDLVWQASDMAQDGAHPSDTGRQKVASQLLKFFQTDKTASSWYLQSPGK
ncbi:hypothetical protein [Lignipirellula cremea]|uniref:hypothetical protein n=1 Tax=Lignipirellula cremea TaxID=2528010 RepID=UPI0011A81843|nr:hypothetical protein [Lignipirellula cremea]